MKTLFDPTHLTVGIIVTLAVAPHCFAQVNFSQPSLRQVSVEQSVNDCANRQEITICLNALSHARMLRQGNEYEPMNADTIMNDAVGLVPLYVLGRLSLLSSDNSAACEYAYAGTDLLGDVTARTRRLSEQDPAAFRNVEQSIAELGSLEQRFRNVEAECTAE